MEQLEEAVSEANEAKQRLATEFSAQIRSKSDAITAATAENERLRDELIDARVQITELQDRVWTFEESSNDLSEQILKVKTKTAQRAVRHKAVEDRLEEVETMHKDVAHRLQRALDHKSKLVSSVFKQSDDSHKLSIFHCWRLKTSKLQKARRVVSKMISSSLVRGFSRWIEYSGEVKGILDKTRRVVSKMMNSSLSHGFSRWVEYSEEVKQKGDMCFKVVKHMMNRRVSMAFDTWHEHAREQCRMEYVCSKIVKRMLNAKLAGAFETWHGMIPPGLALLADTGAA